MILAINTASEKNSIALFEKDRIEVEVLWESYQTQSRELLPAIDQLLKKNHFDLSDLTAIAVFAGPGSYTGLRVGISVANAISWSKNIPVVGIKNLNDYSASRFSALKIAKRTFLITGRKKLNHFSKIVNPHYKSLNFCSPKIKNYGII